jgi:hypothetical protein
MKKTLSIIIISMFTGILTFSAISTVFGADQPAGGKKYTAYNMWYETGKEGAMWTINYKTGIMIPAGTEVTDISVSKKEVSFVTVKDKIKFTANFNIKYHPGKTAEDYAKMMFSEKDFNQLTQGMSQTELDGVKEGVIKVGMSKQAVLTAYGYPPEHKTPDTNGNVWIYWINKFKTKTINFDDSGKTIKQEQAAPDSL